MDFDVKNRKNREQKHFPLIVQFSIDSGNVWGGFLEGLGWVWRILVFLGQFFWRHVLGLVLGTLSKNALGPIWLHFERFGRILSLGGF